MATEPASIRNNPTSIRHNSSRACCIPIIAIVMFIFNNSFFIGSDGAGAQFIHAAAPGVTLADILEPAYVSPIVHSFFPLDGTQNCNGVSEPLLAVQVTELVDGVFIGCTSSHMIVDGTSFWHFFDSWSEISRGSNEITLSSALDRWYEIKATSTISPAIFWGSSSAGSGYMKVGELLMLGLGHAAWQLNKVIATYTEAEAINYLESWVKNPKPFSVRNKIIRDSLLASSSPRFNVYGNDFGWGRPVAVRSGSANKTSAKTTLFPGAEEGSMDIEAFLVPEILQSMIEDAEFVETLTI
ncbi:uncharacterized acetyltransferase At3g50280-like [Vitis riparia]|uniref:uncharacterized acetyltransferase At3g50280-like n=1 Tax=Vitis riparia TaxID=96939 RepID=UPI00155AB7EF|nr:uncharacterized acetyltransferase At3g50280-like [Vitis riparia]